MLPRCLWQTLRRKFRQQRRVDIMCSALDIEARKILHPRRLIMYNNVSSTTTVIATETSFQVVPQQAVATDLMSDPWASNSKFRIAQGVYAKRTILKSHGDRGTRHGTPCSVSGRPTVVSIRVNHRYRQIDWPTRGGQHRTPTGQNSTVTEKHRTGSAQYMSLLASIHGSARSHISAF